MPISDTRKPAAPTPAQQDLMKEIAAQPVIFQARILASLGLPMPTDGGRHDR